MARKLEAVLNLKTAQARRKARTLGQELEKTGRKGKQAGDGTAKSMRAGGDATSKFTGNVVALGASYLGLSALIRSITTVVDKYNEAIKLRDQFTQGAIAMQPAVAPAASQFKVPEPAMSTLIGEIGVAAGAAPGDLRAISSMMTAASSTGLIGGITLGPGGQAQISPADRAKVVSLGTFGQYIQEPTATAPLAKLIAKGMGQDRSPQRLHVVMAQIAEAYRKSQLSNWGEFIQGAVAGTSGMLEQGITFETALGGYAGLAKMQKSGMSAGETWRLVSEQLIQADKPEIVRWIDRQYGSGTYWRLKKEDPDRLMNLIIGGLTSVEGQAKQRLYGRLGIAPELGGRLGRIRGAAGETKAIRGSMAGATGEGMAAELDAWRRGPRATVQAAGLRGALKLGAVGGTTWAASAKAYRDAAETELALLRDEYPGGTWMMELARTRGGELRYRLRQAIHRDLVRRGVGKRNAAKLMSIIYGADIDISGREPVIDYHDDMTPEQRYLFGRSLMHVTGGPMISPEEFESNVRAQSQQGLENLGAGFRRLGMAVGTAYFTHPQDRANGAANRLGELQR